ncbi:hypothetical protein A2630_00340 [Candidatus Woesebacteria bacterium RIFCSPHIGHO2_01_FULL_44_10]|uniref:Uncharacterized protein n=1 Tax=Candidatus Woesebacteria bacterium RIFCSPLOWO2_01_FULL_44_14 TaxID=1802525 RepID=A0A1F8C2L7_9BACT|nr:MAG: hypothetical protein A2630_00340 [Candidatus Woesebacteria bacterium RIFCSPHIGHO2_01_FULL_44_10]OGM53742.1 MAG: hypothetical protein A3F62_03705 [Candidatus Woesebacteria bacterium RIFCSPHIGHO2_12_FULL_44_11]OGM70089.1 MAG: hypothetical protein A2975_03370 [Candidatus Woesebacteria bacterium RIFCSPLOWO2_01_FULL_44_14]
MSGVESLVKNVVCQRVISEKRLLESGFLVLVAEGCPEEVAEEIVLRTETFGTGWFYNLRADVPARRKIFFVPLKVDGVETVVIKEKAPIVVGNPLLKHPTSSVIHEIRTAMVLGEIVKRLDLIEIAVNKKDLIINFSAQRPLGALVDLNSGQRWGFFDYVEGESPRVETSRVGGWNYLPEERRKLYGQIHTALEEVGKAALKAGVEPWDLGVHQVVLDIKKNIVGVTILDTEEYSLKKSGLWKGNSLPPVILFPLF